MMNQAGMARYTHLHDHLTYPSLRGAPCDPVRRVDGKVVGRGKALVRFADGRAVVVLRRRLRLAGHPAGVRER